MRLPAEHWSQHGPWQLVQNYLLFHAMDSRPMMLHVDTCSPAPYISHLIAPSAPLGAVNGQLVLTPNDGLALQRAAPTRVAVPRSSRFVEQVSDSCSTTPACGRAGPGVGGGGGVRGSAPRCRQVGPGGGPGRTWYRPRYYSVVYPQRQTVRPTLCSLQESHSSSGVVALEVL